MEVIIIKKVLITGAAGYIGSMLTYSLLNAGYQVIGVDVLKFGINPLLGALAHPNFTLIRCDICDTDKYADWIDRDTAIINLAAVVGEPACKKYEADAIHTNYDGAKKVIELAGQKEACKLIFVTTCSNYGMVAEGEMADEISQLNPLGLYAQSKVDMEKHLFETVGTALNWTILRFATVYGISPRLRFDLTVNEFTAVGCMEKRLEVFLPHTTRPYVHVRDVARAIMLVLEKPEESRGQIYNVGDSKENYKKQEIVDVVKGLVPEMEVKYVDRGVDLRDYRVSFNKIRDHLGYRVTMRVPDGVAEIHNAISHGLINDVNNKNYYNHL